MATPTGFPFLARGVFWIFVYVLAALAPLVTARIGSGNPGGSGFWMDFSIGLGFAGLSILCLQFGLVARFQRVSAPFGMDALHQFHRQIAYVALLFVFIHPVMIFVSDPGWLALLKPATMTVQARLGLAAFGLLLVIAATSFARKRLRLSYEIWQAAHSVLAMAVVAFGIWHAVSWNHYFASPWQKGVWIIMGVALTGVVLWRRVVQPVRLLRKPWIVEAVSEERGNAWTVKMRPEGHDGFDFLPGQFGWVLLGRSPFRLTQHPFSFSSSAEDQGHVTMTIKSRGDFTRSVRDVEPGTRAYLDGPHGTFTPDRNEGPGFVFIAGGVGITPLISMLRTLRDREDVRPCWLFYGNKDWDTITFREELDALPGNATVVHVLEKAHDGWEGETGFIGADMLKRHLPERQLARLQYFVCGPVPMMDAIEDALISIGVADERIHTERFDVV